MEPLVLQGGTDFVTELAALMFLFYLLVVIFLGHWVRKDAIKRNSNHPTGWGVGVGALLLAGTVPGLFALTAYLVLRGDPLRSSKCYFESVYKQANSLG